MIRIITHDERDTRVEILRFYKDDVQRSFVNAILRRNEFRFE